MAAAFSMRISNVSSEFGPCASAMRRSRSCHPASEYMPLSMREVFLVKYECDDGGGIFFFRDRMVPQEGLEPPSPCGRELLRLVCLPIPPLRRLFDSTC